MIQLKIFLWGSFGTYYDVSHIYISIVIKSLNLWCNHSFVW